MDDATRKHVLSELEIFNFGVPMRALTKLLCLPGDLLLNLTNIKGEDHRGLVRMLANSLVWTTVGILVTILIA
jgi:hypothetical protein